MQNLTLIKQYHNIQLAHMYEHIFCSAIKQLFFGQGLYKSLDYDLLGTTYDSGLIVIDLDGYSPRAITLLDTAMKLQPTINDKSFQTAFYQIISEKQQLLRGQKHEKIMHALYGLSAQPWYTLDDFEIQDLSTSKLSRWPLHLTTQEFKIKRIMVDIQLDESFSRQHSLLIPVFRQLSDVIIRTIADRLSQTYSLYVKNIEYSTKHYSSRALLHAIPHDSLPNAQTICNESLNVIRDMYKSKLTTRLIDRLINYSYTYSINAAPNIEHLIEDTNLIVGSRGWQKIATKENIELLWQNSSILIQLGREKLSQPL